MSSRSGSRRGASSGHINHERWMVSFADFMTLLFSLFVVLFAISTVDQKKLSEMDKSMEQAFGLMESQGNSILDHSRTQSLPIPPIAQQPSIPPVIQNQDQTLVKRLEKVISKASQMGAIQLRTENRGVVIQLKDTRLFESGSATLRAEMIPELMRVAKELAKLAQPLRIEGHTDNVPIKGAGMFRSNWELSAARATSVLQFMLQHTPMSPGQFSVAGYGEYRPIASNQSETGRSRNRRVDIVILNQQAAQQEPAILPEPQQELNHELDQKLKRRP